MRKIRSSSQDRLLEKAEKTYSDSLLFTIDDALRLKHPKDFPTNTARLYGKLAKNCEIGLSDLVFVLNKLPNTYKNKALSHFTFDPFIESILRSSAAVDKKSKNQKQKNLKTKSGKNQQAEPFSFRIATSMFNKSLAFIIESLPIQFQDSMKREIYTFLLQINSISKFLMEIKPRKKIPYLEIPMSLSPHSGHSKSPSSSGAMTSSQSGHIGTAIHLGTAIPQFQTLPV